MEPTNSRLSILPLRPSTLSLLLRNGFDSTYDVYMSSKPGFMGKGCGSIKNFATELNLQSLPEAMRILREIEHACRRTNSNGMASSGDQVDPPKPVTPSNVSTNTTTPYTPKSKVSYATATATSRQPTQSAASLLRSSNQRERPIITCSRSIDTLLGGGVHRGEVTEVVGLPGVGKTQLCMQLCVDTALPTNFGGVNAHSIYIDSEGSFSPERCSDMAKGMVEHVYAAHRRRQNNHQDQGNKRQRIDYNDNDIISFNADTIMNSIHVLRVHDEACQTATIMSIPNLVHHMKNEGKDVKLIVLDSIAFHYRCAIDFKTRTKALLRVASILSNHAHNLDVAIVVVNHMTTKLNSIGNGNPSSITRNSHSSATKSVHVPALGDSWAHVVTSRILLMFPSKNNTDGSTNSRKRNSEARRVCKLAKSPHQAAGEAPFSIFDIGIRDSIAYQRD